MSWSEQRNTDEYVLRNYWIDYNDVTIKNNKK